MNQPVICKELTKSFGTGHTAVHALRGIDLEVQEGEIMMVIGPSGCGKTTLLSIIAGTLNRTSGHAAIFGRDFHEMSEREKAYHRGRDIGFVFQSYNLIPQLTALENVIIPLLLTKQADGNIYKRARELLEAVGLGHRADDYPNHLSGGEKQRTAICRALIHKPKLIVCDEPTAALDSKTGAQVMDLICEQQGTYIVVTHDSRIYRYANRIAKMDDGRIVGVYNSPEEMEHG